MSPWLEKLAGLIKPPKKTDLSGFNPVEPESVDTNSSVAKDTAEQRRNREKEERAEQYMRDQKAADADKDWSAEDQQRAEESFDQQEEFLSRQDTPATKRDIDRAIEDLFNMLVNNNMLVPSPAFEGAVLRVVNGRWVPASVSEMPVASGTGLYLRTSSGQWVQDYIRAT